MPKWIADQFLVDPERKFASLKAGAGLLKSPLLGTEAHPLKGFVHWWDPLLADGWFREARKRMDALKDDESGWPAIMSLEEETTKQIKFRLVIQALDRGYNALNIPWYIHRAARELYWLYMSGAPSPVAMFDCRRNSNGDRAGWFVAGYENPVINDDSKGTIPRVARKLYKSKKSSDVNTEYLMPFDATSIGMNGWSALDDAQRLLLAKKRLTNDWYYQDDLINSMAGGYEGRSAATSSYQSIIPIIAADPKYAGYDPADVAAAMQDVYDSQLYNFGSDVWLAQNENTPLTDDIRLRPTSRDPRQFRAMFSDVKATLGFAHAMDWVDAWIDLILSTEIHEIVISAREMAVYCNQQTLMDGSNVARGGAAAIMGDAAAQYGQASAVVSPELQISVAVVGGLGAALASCTYGISALVAGAYALGVSIFAATAPPSRNNVNIPKDDLNRFKPILERAWLSGNPADTVEGAPRLIIPDAPVSAAPQAPPAGRRIPLLRSVYVPRVSMDYLRKQRAVIPAPILHPAEQYRQLATTDQSSGSMLLPVVGLGVAAFFGYKLLSSRSK